MNELAASIIHSLIRVRPEEVALSLSQIQRQIRCPIRVEISKARRHRRCRNPERLRGRYCLPPARLSFDCPRFEIGINQQVRQIWTSLISLLDLIKELRADDAATLPNSS